MSFRLDWTHAIRDDPDLSSTAKLVAYALATYMDRDGLCWPSVAKLARATSLSRRTVQIAHRELEAFGYLDPGDKKGGARRPNEYRALLPTEEERAHLVHRFQAGKRERKLRKGARDVAKRAQQTTKKGAPRAPELVKNSTENPYVGEDSAVATSSPTRARSRRDAPVAAAIERAKRAAEERDQGDAS